MKDEIKIWLWFYNILAVFIGITIILFIVVLINVIK